MVLVAVLLFLVFCQLISNSLNFANLCHNLFSAAKTYSVSELAFIRAAGLYKQYTGKEYHDFVKDFPIFNKQQSKESVENRSLVDTSET